MADHVGDKNNYNCSYEFSGVEEAEHHIERNGWGKVYERARKGKDGVKRYFLCKKFWDAEIKCPHKFTLIVADGTVLGKSTDGGEPHDHKPRIDLNTSLMVPRTAQGSIGRAEARRDTAGGSRHNTSSLLDSTYEPSIRPRNNARGRGRQGRNPSSRPPAQPEAQLQNLLKMCSSDVVDKMKSIYERKRKDKERDALRLFARLPLDRQKEFIEMQEKQKERESRPQRELVDFVRAEMGPQLSSELLQQSHLSALGIGLELAENIQYDSPIEEEDECEEVSPSPTKGAGPSCWDVAKKKEEVAKENEEDSKKKEEQDQHRTPEKEAVRNDGVESLLEMARDENTIVPDSAGQEPDDTSDTAESTDEDEATIRQFAYSQSSFNERETVLVSDGTPKAVPRASTDTAEDDDITERTPVKSPTGGEQKTPGSNMEQDEDDDMEMEPPTIRKRPISLFTKPPFSAMTRQGGFGKW